MLVKLHDLFTLQLNDKNSQKGFVKYNLYHRETRKIEEMIISCGPCCSMMKFNNVTCDSIYDSNINNYYLIVSAHGW